MSRAERVAAFSGNDSSAILAFDHEPIERQNELSAANCFSRLEFRFLHAFHVNPYPLDKSVR